MGNSPSVIPKVNDVTYVYPKMTLKGLRLNSIESVDLLFPDQMIEVKDFTVVPDVVDGNLNINDPSKQKYLLALNIPDNVSGIFNIQYTYTEPTTGNKNTVDLSNLFGPFAA